MRVKTKTQMNEGEAETSFNDTVDSGKNSEDEDELFFNYCKCSWILTSLLSMAHGRLDGKKKRGGVEGRTRVKRRQCKSFEDEGELF